MHNFQDPEITMIFMIIINNCDDQKVWQNCEEDAIFSGAFSHMILRVIHSDITGQSALAVELFGFYQILSSQPECMMSVSWLTLT